MTITATFTPSGLLPVLAGAAMVLSMNSTAVHAGSLREFRPESSRSTRGDRYASRDMLGSSSPWAEGAAKAALYSETIADPDPWLAKTMQTIEAGRAELHLSAATIEQTEALTALFSILPKERRPTLLFDDSGVANFATATRDVYFHLTLSGESEISWILEKDGAEKEGESVPFDGRRLPSEILADLI